MHWCKHCNIFPKTAKDFLNHLHTKEHIVAAKDKEEHSPWYEVFPNDVSL